MRSARATFPSLFALLAALAMWSVSMNAQADELDKRVGQPVDFAPWAHEWRADRYVQLTPEAYFIPRRLARIDKVYRTAAAALTPDQLKSIYYDMPDLLKKFPPPPAHKLSAGLLWTGGVSKYQVELHWPADAQELPSPDTVEVRDYPTSFGWFGWTVDRILGKPAISADGRTWIYAPPAGEKMDSAYSQHVDAATEMIAVFCDSKVVPSLAVTGASIGRWKRMDLQVRGQNVEPNVNTSVAIAGPVVALPDGQGFVLSLLYAPTAHPGLDSRVTLTSHSERFTVALRDLETNEVSIARRGVSITNMALPQASIPPEKSIRQMTREHPEAKSWEELMQNVRLWTCPAGTNLPSTMPKVDDPPMRVELSDQHWSDAWRAAADQLRGKHMWGGLAFEVGRVAHEMELIGLHDEAAKVYEHFLSAPGAKSDGDYSDGNGALERAESLRHDMGYSHDGTHASTGRLLFAMCERYFVTGDRAWFAKNRARLEAAADWIIRKRRDYMKDVPNRDQLFVVGLMPPQMLGDYALPSCDWHWYYCDDAFALQGLSRFADALSAVDAEAGKKYCAEAEAFRSDLHRAAVKEAELAPVRRGRDGAYHSFLPRMAYARGLTGPELGAPQFPDCDMFMGSLPLAEPFAAMDANDPRMIETLDAMEEMGTSTFAPPRQAERKAKGLPAGDAWFWTPYSRLPKASHNANIYLLQDDVPSFLRFWMNQYAATVGANGKFSEAWQLDNFNDCTNPDNGTAGWFMENFRNLLVMEEGGSLWIARATPRAWLQQGKRIAVKSAPTYFGTTNYEIVSDVDHGKIKASIDISSRVAPKALLLRFRHPTSAPIKAVSIDGRPSNDFNTGKETITIRNFAGHVTVLASY